jgi:acetoacetate decarboxylase
MKLVRSPENLQQRRKKFAEGGLLANTNMVLTIFKTDPDIVKEVLPPPLTPSPEPLGHAYVAEFQKTNFGINYKEAALFLQAQYNGEIGNYCLAMPVDNDMAMVAGREVYGYPKKIAESITLTRQDNHVQGTCIRHGIAIIEITADLQAPFPDKLGGSPDFLFKAFPSIDQIGIDENPRFLRVQHKQEYGPIEIGRGTLTLNQSADDPLHEIPIKEVTMSAYTSNTNIWMRPATVLKELKPADCLPYLFTKIDAEM